MLLSISYTFLFFCTILLFSINQVRVKQEKTFACRNYNNMMFNIKNNATQIGILGGSFDPIHYGHLAIAEAARDFFKLDAVIFIPAGEPPHKKALGANAEQRYLMTLLAINEHPDFFVSRCEIDRPGRSYTIDTLHYLKQLYPLAKLFLLMGFDSAVEFSGWRDADAILKLATIIAATRPGFTTEQLTEAENSGVQLLHTPGLQISSSELRSRIANAQSVRFLLPAPVIDFINREGLYRTNNL